MPRLAAARSGRRVQVKKREVDFSFWPSKPGLRHHYGLQSRLFALDPWAVIRQTIQSECDDTRRDEALAALEQAEGFYFMGTERGTEAAQPLALYYSYMNLAKAFCLLKRTRPTFDQAQHGLSEKLDSGHRELIDAFLNAFPTSATQANNFDELLAALTGTGLAASTRFNLPALLPQILSGHRLWAQAADELERFIAIDELQFWQNTNAHLIWLRIYFVSQDLTRLGITHQRLLSESGLAGSFRQVKSNIKGRICLEQTQPHQCQNNYVADQLHHLVNAVRLNLWAAVSSVPPYRRYYVYLSPLAEAAQRLPQILSIYAVTYYLGSITRYRPHHFQELLRKEYGPRIRDFVSGQPLQFLYLMASEIAGREVTRPAIL
jgi:hypothetical protein